MYKTPFDTMISISSDIGRVTGGISIMVARRRLNVPLLRDYINLLRKIADRLERFCDNI